MPSPKHFRVPHVLAGIQEDTQNPFLKLLLRFKTFETKNWPVCIETYNDSGSPGHMAAQSMDLPR